MSNNKYSQFSPSETRKRVFPDLSDKVDLNWVVLLKSLGEVRGPWFTGFGPDNARMWSAKMSYGAKSVEETGRTKQSALNATQRELAFISLKAGYSPLCDYLGFLASAGYPLSVFSPTRLEGVEEGFSGITLVIDDLEVWASTKKEAEQKLSYQLIMRLLNIKTYFNSVGSSIKEKVDATKNISNPLLGDKEVLWMGIAQAAFDYYCLVKSRKVDCALSPDTVCYAIKQYLDISEISSLYVALAVGEILQNPVMMGQAISFFDHVMIIEILEETAETIPQKDHFNNNNWKWDGRENKKDDYSIVMPVQRFYGSNVVGSLLRDMSKPGF